MSTDRECIKIWNIYGVKYYSAIKRNEIESVAVMWSLSQRVIDLESITESEVRKRKINIAY